MAYLVDLINGENETSITDAHRLGGRQPTESRLRFRHEIGLLDEQFRLKDHLTCGAVLLRGKVGRTHLEHEKGMHVPMAPHYWGWIEEGTIEQS